MQKILRVVVLLLFVAVQFSCTAQNKSSKESSSLDLSSESAKFSYALGLEVGASLQNITENTEIDVNVLTRAIKDYLNKDNLLLSQQEAAEIKKTVFPRLQAEHAEKMKVTAEKNRKDEEMFLKTNKTKDGIINTASGLQYEIIHAGKGNTPGPLDKVSVNYKGTLLDGSEFDNSYKRGEPSSFQVKQVIPGWSEALQLMKVGGKYKLYIPSKLAYGERGAGMQIGPHSMLIFEIELIDIEKK